MEIEALLLELDGVQQAAVVGYPDARLNEVAVAYVQRRAGSTLSEKDVVEHCRGKVATFKIPRHVLFVEAMPMTASGKIRKVELRDDAKQQLGTDTAAGQ
jgi:fatty-acyl-CoA synthase